MIGFFHLSKLPAMRVPALSPRTGDRQRVILVRKFRRVETSGNTDFQRARDISCLHVELQCIAFCGISVPLKTHTISRVQSRYTFFDRLVGRS